MLEGPKMSLELPESLSNKVNDFPEYRMGANKVKLVLKDGTEIKDVYIGWAKSIVKVGNRLIKSSEELTFKIEDIDDDINDI
jgi:hypothetical protein